jgi:NAD(P)-dependent dehydrogenase (short-subunit alcohol dehydrogenase family)
MDRYACVTGADRGIGLEIVRQLLTKDYTVFAGRFMKDVYLLEGMKDEYRNHLHIVDLDISEDRSVENVRKYIFNNTTKLDILINNGAILGDIEATIFHRLDFEEMQRVFNTTALGALRVSNVLVPILMKSSTRLIVNISSEAGSIGSCNRKSWFAYCMSKAALNISSVIIHNQLKEQGGQVLVIHPGWVKTYMQGKLDEEAILTPEASAEHIMKLILDHDKYKDEKPAFIDYLGNTIEW